MVSNMGLISMLESQFKGATSATGGKEQTELFRAKVEILRLNAENEALTSENHQLSDYCSQTVSRLEAQLKEKSRDLDSLASILQTMIISGRRVHQLPLCIRKGRPRRILRVRP